MVRDESGSTSGVLRLLSKGGQRTVVVVEAFIDEGGCDQHAPVVSVGCYFAAHENWAAFEQSWSRVLSKAGIDCFHAIDHPHLWGPMLSHINEFGVRGTLATIGKDSYRKHFSERAKSRYGNAYACCAIGAALKVAERASADGLRPMAFVIEDGQPSVTMCGKR